MHWAADLRVIAPCELNYLFTNSLSLAWAVPDSCADTMIECGSVGKLSLCVLSTSPHLSLPHLSCNKGDTMKASGCSRRGTVGPMCICQLHRACTMLVRPLIAGSCAQWLLCSVTRCSDQTMLEPACHVGMHARRSLQRTSQGGAGASHACMPLVLARAQR
jgi:hypothetical protein